MSRPFWKSLNWEKGLIALMSVMLLVAAILIYQMFMEKNQPLYKEIRSLGRVVETECLVKRFPKCKWRVFTEVDSVKYSFEFWGSPYQKIEGEVKLYERGDSYYVWLWPAGRYYRITGAVMQKGGSK